jgi:hypothetical protein
MPKSWVKDYFKHILVDSAEEYLRSSNKGGTKARTTLSEVVAERIREAVRAENDEELLPNPLEKVHFLPILCVLKY